MPCLPAERRWTTSQATPEHISYVCHVRGVEVAQVKARQTSASIEHAIHVGHLLGVEVAQVNVRQTFTVIEHAGHISYLRRVEVLHVQDGLEVFHTHKPIEG